MKKKNAVKKSLKVAVALSVFTVPAFAGTNVPGMVFAPSQNMENPLYMPGQNMFYSKLTNGLMLKVADDSTAHKLRDHDGNVEFPIIRIQEELGYGITDRLAVHLSAQYTHDDKIDRTGLSAGRLGATWRFLKTRDNFVWDLYADLHLGGLGKMRGQYDILSIDMATMNPTGVFEYDNYSNGMWGYHVGTRVGKVWDKLTASAFVEMLQTFGDDNTRIRIATMGNAKQLAASLPNEVAVELKSTTEVNAGANLFYQWTNRWSSGAWFKYNHHADQGVDHITTELSGMAAQLKPVVEAKLADMNDGFDEYIIGLSAAYQYTEHAQVALYGEYTFDTAHDMSQNGTDAKVEMGVRLNFTF